MKALSKALESGQARGYERLNAAESDSLSSKSQAGKPAGNLFQRWLVKFFKREDQSQPTYSRASVTAMLQQDYGLSVGSRVMAGSTNRPLTARKIVQLHSKAAKIKHQLEHKNEKHAGQWGDVNNPKSMAGKLFKEHSGVSCKALPDFERERLNQHIQQVFYQQNDHAISRQEARHLILAALEQHSYGFTEAASNTANALGMSGDLSSPAFDKWLSSQSLSLQSRALLRNFQANSVQSARLQWQSPLEQIEREWSRQIEEVEKHRSSLKQSLRVLENGGAPELNENIRQAMAFDILHQLKQADGQTRFIEALSKTDFRSPESFQKARIHNLQTAIRVIDTALDSDTVSSKRRPHFYRLKKSLEQELKLTHQQPRNKPMLMKKAIREDARVLRKSLVEAGMNEKKMAKAWKKVSAELGNAREWKTIEKTIPIRSEEKLIDYRSVQVPAAQMRMHIKGQPQGARDPFPVTYAGQGRSSADPKEPVHAINLFNSRLEEKGSVLYSGLRTGTLVPYGFGESTENQDQVRRDIAENRARELLEAAFVEKFSQLSETRQKSILAGEPLPFDFVTSSLLSPDQVRHLSGIHDDELVFQRLQDETLQRLCREPLQMEIIDSNGNPRTVTADIRLASFNIPINRIGLKPLYSIPAQTWSEADRENDIALEVLIGNAHIDSTVGGMVGDWLRGPGRDSKDREKVLQLTQQIRRMYTGKQHHTEGKDAYKLVERVQLLAWMIGAVPHFSCKSGKDRTGEADARIKELAIEIDNLGYVPEFDAPLTQEHKERVQTAMFAGGNLEVQWYNINVPSFKTATGKADQGALYKVIH
ncbi:inositol phosphate phosphatase SopB [Parendozoicomonas haliclonae]|uniref:Inositol phosphate phosphatase SopB n=1 Tax=Parendozoicomonas haliclonae TaxID=1960125 RepID=A0A1X7AG52_9GAMM|nr:inositol phosphate phosphatase SopB [Parendozoicomonas haliclonae]SMA32118.1 Inositol phosphate phosphatase SopB [Parendozoicomonas haliclonae]